MGVPSTIAPAPTVAAPTAPVPTAPVPIAPVPIAPVGAGLPPRPPFGPGAEPPAPANAERGHIGVA
jgi:hypothetical protein